MTQATQKGDGAAVAAVESETAVAGPSRRRIIQGAGALAGLIAAPAILRSGRAYAYAGSSLFPLGVASGDPRANSVVLWTRLAPDPLNGGGMAASPVPVTWKVATDPRMRNVLTGGTVIAWPNHGHAVTVTATGLPADGWYFYQFEALGECSRVGPKRLRPLDVVLLALFAAARQQDHQHPPSRRNKPDTQAPNRSGIQARPRPSRSTDCPARAA